MQSHGLALSQCGDREEEDLELSFLLKNIKFIVTGNNHSNSVLLGFHGTVKKKPLDLVIALRKGNLSWRSHQT